MSSRFCFRKHANKELEDIRTTPHALVPTVLERLRAKDHEWRESRDGLSLACQGVTFKMTDTRSMLSKSLVSELETLYDERQSKIEEGVAVENGPHLTLEYPDDMSVIYDGNELIIHHIERQQSTPEDEKRTIKKYLRRLMPDLLNMAAQHLSDDEDDADSDGKFVL